MKTHPTIGNLVVEERAASVALRLRTDHDGEAVFTFREIAAVADLLAGIRAPAIPEQTSGGVFD